MVYKAGTNGTNGTKMVPQSMVPRHHDTNGTTKRGANGTNGIPMVPLYQVPWYQWYHGTKYHGTINQDSIAREALHSHWSLFPGLACGSKMPRRLQNVQLFSFLTKNADSSTFLEAFLSKSASGVSKTYNCFHF